jgi:hypothetical protein
MFQITIRSGGDTLDAFSLRANYYSKLPADLMDVAGERVFRQSRRRKPGG